MSNEALDAATRQAAADETTIETVLKKVNLRSIDIAKMKRLASLFSDELGDDPKEIEILSYFFRASFAAFLASGEIEKKIAEIKGK